MTATLETPILDTPNTLDNAPQLGRKYTIEEFFALSDDGNTYELVDGELVEKDRTIEGMPGPSPLHAKVVAKFSRYFDEFFETHSAGLTLPNAAFVLNVAGVEFVRRPDVGVLDAVRSAGLDLTVAIQGPPDLAIEVISTTDMWSEIITKVREYQTAGTKLIWVVDPFGSGVFVYRQNQRTADLLGLDEELDGEDVIEGFKLRVGLLFE